MEFMFKLKPITWNDGYYSTYSEETIIIPDIAVIQTTYKILPVSGCYSTQIIFANNKTIDTYFKTKEECKQWCEEIREKMCKEFFSQVCQNLFI